MLRKRWEKGKKIGFLPPSNKSLAPSYDDRALILLPTKGKLGHLSPSSLRSNRSIDLAWASVVAGVEVPRSSREVTPRAFLSSAELDRCIRFELSCLF